MSALKNYRYLKEQIKYFPLYQ